MELQREPGAGLALPFMGHRPPDNQINLCKSSPELHRPVVATDFVCTSFRVPGHPEKGRMGR